jgi:hypothetical protein
MKCYFQGCSQEGDTKEHIPPKSFFPKDHRNNLITVRSCQEHNNEKSGDDIYALAQICLNSSPKNKAREVFMKSIAPQLGFNNDSLRKLLIEDSKVLENGSVKYKVDVSRLNKFFNALSCGLIYHVSKEQLPGNYTMHNIYNNLVDESLTDKEFNLMEIIKHFYDGKVPEILVFGKANLENEDIYTTKIFGLEDFNSSITIVHKFFGHFKVISMLSNIIQ